MDTTIRSHARIEGLDMLRGLAILLVMVRHSWPEYVGGGGIVGVVAFFTLSGYLITGLLLADITKFGRVRYGRFYRNRAIRLVPPLVFLLLAFVLFEGIFDISGTRDEVVRSLLVAITYTGNIPGFDHGSESLSHLWTLASEEQFYLLWPILLLFGVRLRKLRVVLVGSAVVILAALVVTLWFARSDVVSVYTLPATWTVSMVIGAAAQVGKNQLSTLLAGRRASIAAIAGVVGLAVLALIPGAKSSVLTYLIGGPLIAVFTVMVMWKLRDWIVVPLAFRPLVWLGTISYAAYLWNFPIGTWLHDVGLGYESKFLALVLTLVAAAISWFLVETPFNRLKVRLDAGAKQRLAVTGEIPAEQVLAEPPVRLH